jgi:hypothetical protein
MNSQIVNSYFEMSSKYVAGHRDIRFFFFAFLQFDWRNDKIKW